MGKEAEHVHAIVDCNDYDASPCDAFAVEFHFRRISHLKPAAEIPYEYRQAILCCLCGSPDVQIQTVLIHGNLRIDMPFPGIDVIRVKTRYRLHGDRRELCAEPLPLPWDDGLRCPPAVLSHRRCRERYPLKRGDARIRCRNTPNQSSFYSRLPDHV